MILGWRPTRPQRAVLFVKPPARRALSSWVLYHPQAARLTENHDVSRAFDLQADIYQCILV